jgi:phage head maturation protease
MQLPSLNVSGRAVPLNIAAWVGATLTAFQPGCFARDELSNRDIELRINHGAYAVGSATVFEHRDGGDQVLFFCGEVEHADWPEVLKRLDCRGLIHGVSIGFRAIEQQIIDGINVVSQARLIEISLMVNNGRPSFGGTTVRAGNLWTPRPALN